MTSSEGLGQLVARLAQTNTELWHEEDKARLDDEKTVFQAKRNIDRLNQQRNDLIEKIDDYVLEALRTKGGPARG